GDGDPVVAQAARRRRVPVADRAPGRGGNRRTRTCRRKEAAMSETTVTAPSYEVRARRSGIVRPAHDTAAVAQRNLIALWRVPQAIVFTAIQPVVFVFLWRYVFG